MISNAEQDLNQVVFNKKRLGAQLPTTPGLADLTR
jgi:hypothetical protein